MQYTVQTQDAFGDDDLVRLETREYKCGCVHEIGYDAKGKEQLVHFSACSECWADLEAHLDEIALAQTSQLTLPLP